MILEIVRQMLLHDLLKMVDMAIPWMEYAASRPVFVIQGSQPFIRIRSQILPLALSVRIPRIPSPFCACVLVIQEFSRTLLLDQLGKRRRRVL